MAIYMQPLEGTETGNERRSPLTFLTFKEFTQRDPIYETQSAIRQKLTRHVLAVSTSVSSLNFFKLFFTVKVLFSPLTLL